ncbi:MAG: LysM domain-containing protein, partial [Bacteroidota bacterium]
NLNQKMPTIIVEPYKVQEGDTLSKIAKKFYGDESRWPEIAEANDNLKPEELKVGQTLRIKQAITPVFKI